MTNKPPVGATRTLWMAFWRTQGQAWRVEPEVDEGRQHELRNSDALSGHRLSRADLEWLLHHWRQTNMASARGLDMSGAQLPQVDLTDLPLQLADMSSANLCAADLRGAD